MSPRMRKVMPLAEWPANDQDAWMHALLGGDDGEGAALDWMPATITKNQLAYGRLLQALANWGLLDSDGDPADRLIPSIISRFIETMMAKGLADHSVAMIMSALTDTALVMMPNQDWSWLRAKARAIARTAKSVRDPASGRIDPGEIYRLGLRIMDEVMSPAWHGRSHPATRFGEGLSIALVAAIPALRSRALRELRPDDLTRVDDAYQVTVRVETTKTRHTTDTYPLPPELTLYIQQYVHVLRPDLLKGLPPTNALLLSGAGRAYSGTYLWARVVSHTLPAFKLKVGLHRVRHCAATAIAIKTPERVMDTKAILGQASIATSQKHYNLATARVATDRFQGAMLALIDENE
jgi:integrase